MCSALCSTRCRFISQECLGFWIHIKAKPELWSAEEPTFFFVLIPPPPSWSQRWWWYTSDIWPTWGTRSPQPTLQNHPVRKKKEQNNPCNCLSANLPQSYMDRHLWLSHTQASISVTFNADLNTELKLNRLIPAMFSPSIAQCSEIGFYFYIFCRNNESSE